MFFGSCDFSLKLISVHRLYWERRDVAIPPKKSFAISYREVGDSSFYLPSRTLEVTDGDMLYFPKGCGYRIRAGRERLYSVDFEIIGTPPPEILKFSAKKRPFFETAFREMYRIWTSRETGYYARTLSYLYRVISEIVREGEEERADPAYSRLKPALSRIYSDFADPTLSVASLAEHIGVSHTYFRRIFERCIGKRPLDFIREVRIDRAAELLESGFYSVEDVASMCGFSDSKYFSTVFKQQKGVPPSKY